MDLDMAELKVNSVRMLLKVAACISGADIEPGGATAVRLCPNYDGQPPKYHGPDETNERQNVTENAPVQSHFS